MDFDYLRVPKREFGIDGFSGMSVDLGELEQFEDNVRKKFHSHGLKARMFQNEYMWGGSLRNLVVNQSFIRVSHHL